VKTGTQRAELAPPLASAAEAVALEDVVFTYRDGQWPALKGVSLMQRRGEMIGIMGRSGAGKSTLAKCLNAIIPGFEEGKFKGLVRISGRPVGGERVCDMAPRVGMVFQDFEAQLFSTNVAHEVAFAMEQIGLAPAEIRARLGPALAAVGLAGFEERDPTSLSGGEKQRLAIASVIALKPDVIVLDEPTTDLDPVGRMEVFALIRRLRDQGLTLFVIEHETEEMRECDHLLLMREGEIVASGRPAEILPRLDLLEACGVRPPALNRVLTHLKIAEHARDVDEAEVLLRKALPSISTSSPKIAPPSGADGLPAPPLVEIRGLTQIYGGETRAVDGVDLTINSGEFVAIIGQNGSGKTTLAKHIVGLLKPSAGDVMLGGRAAAEMPAAVIATQAGYVFQNPDHQIFAATVEDEIAFGPRNFGLPAAEIQERCERVLQAVGLAGLRKRDPFLLGRGERQRLAVASVLVLEPKLLILDEPTTGLDYPQQRRMMDLIAEINRVGTTIVIITHTPWLVAEYARRAVLMSKGRKLFDGPVRELFKREDLLLRASFRLPEVTALGHRFGVTALTVEELLAALGVTD
jgi:energy-coupling factor transporter ATP-binding protein EcfA2